MWALLHAVLDNNIFILFYIFQTYLPHYCIYYNNIFILFKCAYAVPIWGHQIDFLTATYSPQNGEDCICNLRLILLYNFIYYKSIYYTILYITKIPQSYLTMHMHLGIANRYFLQIMLYFFLPKNAIISVNLVSSKHLPV